MRTKTEVEKVFHRLLKSGELRRMPKSRKDAETLSALAATIFDPRETFTETELNDQLADWLVGFAAPSGLDHVTVRRYMVDYYFLLRDPDGANYKTNQAVINLVLEPEAREVQPAEILKQATADRLQRKRSSMA